MKNVSHNLPCPASDCPAGADESQGVAELKAWWRTALGQSCPAVLSVHPHALQLADEFLRQTRGVGLKGLSGPDVVTEVLGALERIVDSELLHDADVSDVTLETFEMLEQLRELGTEVLPLSAVYARQAEIAAFQGKLISA